MAADSKRKRYLRRLKRERSQLRHAIGYQQGLHQQQMKTLFDKLMEAQAELRDLKPQPSITIKTLPDDVENVGYVEPIAAGADDVSAADIYPAGPISEEMNRDCCVDDSPAS